MSAASMFDPILVDPWSASAEQNKSSAIELCGDLGAGRSFTFEAELDEGADR